LEGPGWSGRWASWRTTAVGPRRYISLKLVAPKFSKARIIIHHTLLWTGRCATGDETQDVVGEVAAQGEVGGADVTVDIEFDGRGVGAEADVA